MSSKDRVIAKWALLLFAPVLSFFVSLYDAYEKNSKVVLILFCGLVGWLMFPYNTDLDLYAYYEYIRSYGEPNKTAFLGGLSDFLSFDTNVKDYYFESIVYYVSQVTSNYHFVFLVIGLVYGFFFATAMGIITKEIDDSGDKKYHLTLLFIIFITIPFTYISSVRFWTAAWVAICISLKVFVDKKYYYTLFLPFLVFIHGTFLVFIVLFCITLLIKRIPRINRPLIVLVYLSIPLSFLSIYVGEALYNYLPTPLQHTADFYFSEENLARKSLQGSGYYYVSTIFKSIVTAFKYIMIVLLLNKRWSISDKYPGIHVLTLLMLAFSLFTMGIPSLGGRFFNVAFPLVVFLWICTFKFNDYKQFVYLTPVVFSFDFIYWLYYYVRGTTGIVQLFLSPFFSIFDFI